MRHRFLRLLARRAPRPTPCATPATASAGPLARIPVIEIGDGGPVALFEAAPERAEALINAGRALLPGPTLDLLERLSQRWAERADNPYLGEIAAIATRMPAGAWFMNLCFEWGCTTGVMANPEGRGMRMLRTLDWPFPGLGRWLVVAHGRSPAGDFYNLTWAGFVGVVTALAPGRFAVALNQAPLVRRGPWPFWVDWAIGRALVYRSRALPPAHLLRRAVESCRDYGAACTLLAQTPIALPAIFVVAGTAPGEGCVIERLGRRTFVHEAPVAAANAWLTPDLRGDPRGIDCLRRQRLMEEFCRGRVDGFDWLVPPILNPETRLAATLDAAPGTLCLRGFETEGPVTETLEIDHGRNGQKR